MTPYSFLACVFAHAGARLAAAALLAVVLPAATVSAPSAAYTAPDGVSITVHSLPPDVCDALAAAPPDGLAVACRL